VSNLGDLAFVWCELMRNESARLERKRRPTLPAECARSQKISLYCGVEEKGGGGSAAHRPRASGAPFLPSSNLNVTVNIINFTVYLFICLIYRCFNTSTLYILL
jgi:hypothetical protein